LARAYSHRSGQRSGPWTDSPSRRRRRSAWGRAARRHRASKVGGLLLMAVSISLMALLLWRGLTTVL
jgi:hypothetical protein